MSELLDIVKDYGVWAGLAIFFWYQQFQDKKALQKTVNEHYVDTKREIDKLKEFQQGKMVEMLNDYNSALEQYNQCMRENNDIMRENSNAMRRVCDVIAIQTHGGK